MTKDPKNLPISIQHKLRNIAKSKGGNSETLLHRYVAERFLYRLSLSKYNDQFFLKGAFLFTIWEDGPYRATRDIDFLGKVSDQIETLEEILKNISSIPYEKDGLSFDTDSIKGEIIREGQSYGGIRLKQDVYLGKAKIVLQIDVGFGDIITPKAEKNEFPTLLAMDIPKINTYPIYTVIAEKLEAMVSLDIDNSRMKDFFDLWFLTQKFEIDSNELSKAIKNTFAQRNTAIPIGPPTALTEEFYLNEDKNKQWQAFINRSELADRSLKLKEVVGVLNQLFTPALASLR